MTRADYENFDYLIGMDHNNLRNMMRILRMIRLERFRYSLIGRRSLATLQIHGIQEILI